jgi:hypothetical protein
MGRREAHRKYQPEMLLVKSSLGRPIIILKWILWIEDAD